MAGREHAGEVRSLLEITVEESEAPDFVAVVICEGEAGVRFVAVVFVEAGGEPRFGRGAVEMADSFGEVQGLRVGA